jgi:peroxiredoxin
MSNVMPPIDPGACGIMGIKRRLDHPQEAPMNTDPQELALGARAPEFSLLAVDGRTYAFDDIAGRNGTVVMFICNHCPYVKAVADRIVRDMRDLREHGIGAIAISSNDATGYPEDSFENMKAFAGAHRFDFPYAYDESQDVARAYGAICTPEFFGFDAKHALRYRGRLDASRKEPAPNAPRELFDAMVGVARTGAGPAMQNPAFGCSIKWRID